jgi:hypothetical protein
MMNTSSLYNIYYNFLINNFISSLIVLPSQLQFYDRFVFNLFVSEFLIL